VSLTDAQLRMIRDEIGDTTPPTDDDLFGMFDDLVDQAAPATWQAVAISVLKRRYAQYMTDGTSSSLTIPGVVAIAGSRQEGILAPQLLEQIRRLEAQTRAGGGRIASPYPRIGSWHGSRNIHVEPFTL
jgi:hypothetical protein